MASNIESNGLSIDDYFVSREFFRQGDLYMWGSGSLSGNGNPSEGNYTSPVQITKPGLNWKQLSNGYYFSAGVKTDGTLWTWGVNGYGQLATNDTTNRNTVTQIGSNTNWKQVSTGYQIAHAIKTDGTLWAWGRNSYGALGVGDATSRSSPTQIYSETAWKACTTMVWGGAALKLDGTLWTWGRNNSGQLGDSGADRSSPVQIGTDQWKQVSAGGGYLMGGIRTDGTLWMWGYNLAGALGDNTNTNRNSPVQTAAGGSNWKQLNVSRWNFAGAIKTDGTLWMWGLGTSGQLGNGGLLSTSSPVQISGGGTNWKQITSGRGSGAAIKTDGTLWTWGASTNGQLGGGVTRSTPAQIGTGILWSNLISTSHTYVYGAVAFV